MTKTKVRMVTEKSGGDQCWKDTENTLQKILHLKMLKTREKMIWMIGVVWQKLLNQTTTDFCVVT